MRLANMVGGARPIKQFIARQIRKEERPLHVLDVGAGDGSLAVSASRWARSQGLEVRFTCVDMDRSAAERAKEIIPAGSDVRFLHGDVFDMSGRDYDCVTASMFLHHFPDERLQEVVLHLAGLARGSVFINDLHRSWPTYLVAWLMSRAFDSVVRHDATLSVARGFRRQELADALARIPGASVRSGRCFPGRVWAEVRIAGGAT
jgi:2-polyprenyl-3-methyl-5-hydroxy-6-metoxy-1,4-benzoquinol methylase